MMKLYSKTQIVLLILSIVIAAVKSSEIRWDHTFDLDEKFRLLWKVKEPDIVFEVQVQTLGYVGFGFTRSEYIYGADMVVGWVDNKHTFFQVSQNKNSLCVSRIF
jgi:DOMON domain